MPAQAMGYAREYDAIRHWREHRPASFVKAGVHALGGLEATRKQVGQGAALGWCKQHSPHPWLLGGTEALDDARMFKCLPQLHLPARVHALDTFLGSTLAIGVRRAGGRAPSGDRRSGERVGEVALALETLPPVACGQCYRCS